MSEASYIPRLYGRRQDKPLKRRQAALMEQLLPVVGIDEPTGPIRPGDILPGKAAYWLEVGFGGGEHLAWQAAQHPDIGMIGAEPFVNGVAKLLCEIEDVGLENVRIRHGDARPVIENLAAGSIDRIFVLHPDPWPKKRHLKRRMISEWFFDQAARLLAPGGELRVASDIPDYIRWTLMHARRADAFEWAAESRSDWENRPADWPQTRYEQKSRREGRMPAYLVFRRRAEKEGA